MHSTSPTILRALREARGVLRTDCTAATARQAIRCAQRILTEFERQDVPRDPTISTTSLGADLLEADTQVAEEPTKDSIWHAVSLATTVLCLGTYPEGCDLEVDWIFATLYK